MYGRKTAWYGSVNDGKLQAPTFLALRYGGADACCQSEKPTVEFFEIRASVYSFKVKASAES